MKITLKKFCAKSRLPESLIRATVRQAGGWQSFTESALDISRHGADGGFHGFIYYTDTVKFSNRNMPAILEACGEMAREFGESSRYALIAGFNCLKMDADTVADAIHNPRSDEHTQVLNALAWFALEECARAYSDMSE